MFKLIAPIALTMFSVSASNDEPPAQDSEISGLARRLLGEYNNKEWQKDNHKWGNYNQKYNIDRNLGDRYDYDGYRPNYYDQKQRGWNKDYKQNYEPNYGLYSANEGGNPGDNNDNLRLIDPEARSDDDTNIASLSRYGRYGRNNYYGYNRYYRNKHNNNYGSYWSTQGDGYLDEQDIQNDIDLDNDNQVNIDIDAGDHNDIDVNNEINIYNNVDNDNKQYNGKKKYEDIKVKVELNKDELNKDDSKVGSNSDEEDIEVDVHIGDDFTK